MAQVVPVKLDTGSSDWQSWARQHKHEGSGIPIVYVVRADGKTLYAKSGSLRTDDLKQLLTAALADAGIILNENDAARIKTTQLKFEKLRKEGDVESAIKALKPINKYLDKSGRIPSFATSAVNLNSSLESLVNDAIEKIQANRKKLESSAELSETNGPRQFDNILGFVINSSRFVPQKLN